MIKKMRDLPLLAKIVLHSLHTYDNMALERRTTATA